ncbi:MAG: hypothetical protein KAG66_21870, partial [Methylococcales bacterium]|nr:hypothetical protein [Methylococcales bacterium]
MQFQSSGALIYNWHGPNQFVSTGQSPNLSAATLNLGGTYEVVGANAYGCTDTLSVQVQIAANPDPGYGDSISLCRIDGAIDLFSILGGTPEPGGLWYGPAALMNGDRGTFDPGTMPSGTYSYGVTFAFPCNVTQLADVVVEVVDSVTAQASSNSPILRGATLVLRASGGYAYQWFGPNGFQATGSEVFVYNADTLASGSYSVIVSTAGGCSELVQLNAQVGLGVEMRIATGVFLEGPFDFATGMMHDDMRAKGIVPILEPYSGMGYNFVGGGQETTTALALARNGSDAIVDWVVLELRDASNPSIVLHSRAALLQRDGDIVDVDGVSEVGFYGVGVGDYHLSVWHRNHIQIMSGQPLNIQD